MGRLVASICGKLSSLRFPLPKAAGSNPGSVYPSHIFMQALFPENTDGCAPLNSSRLIPGSEMHVLAVAPLRDGSCQRLFMTSTSSKMIFITTAKDKAQKSFSLFLISLNLFLVWASLCVCKPVCECSHLLANSLPGSMPLWCNLSSSYFQVFFSKCQAWRRVSQIKWMFIVSFIFQGSLGRKHAHTEKNTDTDTQYGPLKFLLSHLFFSFLNIQVHQTKLMVFFFNTSFGHEKWKQEWMVNITATLCISWDGLSRRTRPRRAKVWIINQSRKKHLNKWDGIGSSQPATHVINTWKNCQARTDQGCHLL